MIQTDYLFDMETADPDDAFALALLATHPRSNLVGVTIHPGGPDQVGLVIHILDILGKYNVPIGIGEIKSNKARVSLFHYDWLGQVPVGIPHGSATEVIRDVLKSHPNTHLVTGAALTNIGKAAREVSPFFPEWTCQGGFAGDNIVPPELRLEKFNGRLTCPTFNLNGDPNAALELLTGIPPVIGIRRMVSKNVCHGIIWGPEFNEKIPSGAHPGLDLIKSGMKHYFERHPNGKALHDVVAAAAALSPSIGTWEKVVPYRQKGEWGCRKPSPDDATPLSEILIKLKMDEFVEAMAK